MAASDLINLPGLIDNAKCFALVRQHRWPEGVRCPCAAAAPSSGTGATTRSSAGSGIGARHALGVSTNSPARCWSGTTSRCGYGCFAFISWD